jgi:carbonic anhydrase/acetyltransferase-like protein (isoleucine patch superfamily)
VIDETAFVAGGAIVGNRCVIGPGSFVGRRCHLADDAVVEARAVVHASEDRDGETFVGEGARIGAGATVGGPLTVGRGAVVRPGAVVLSDVPAFAIIEGNPGAVAGYTTVTTGDETALVQAPTRPLDSVDVCGATLTRLPEFLDLRGSLSVIQQDAGLAYAPRRVFFTYDIANRRIRGSHAHRTLHETLIVVGGSATIVVDDGDNRKQVRLDSPSLALHCPPMLWLTQYDYSPGATLVVLASDGYDEADYIREYDTFLNELRG